MCCGRYAIASVPVNSLSEKQKLVFCESVGRAEGYAAARGISAEELGRVVKAAMEVGRGIIEAADAEVERLQGKA